MKSERERRVCPNCGNRSLAYFTGLGLWICSECEYNSSEPSQKEAEKGTFR